MKLKDTYSLEGKLRPNNILKSRDITLPTKVCLVKAYCFSSGHVWMWELDCEESWVPKNWCFSPMVLEKTLKSPLDCKEIQLVHPKGDQSWLFFGRTDAEAETPVLWPPHAKSWLIGKDPDPGRDWGAGGEGDDRGWDGWMASLTRWAWVWVDSRSWWWTGRPGMLQFTGSQRVGHDWVTELNWTKLKSSFALNGSFLNLCLDLPVCMCVCVCVCVCVHVCTYVYATVSLKLKPTFYFEPFKQHLN